MSWAWIGVGVGLLKRVDSRSALFWRSLTPAAVSWSTGWESGGVGWVFFVGGMWYKCICSCLAEDGRSTAAVQTVIESTDAPKPPTASRGARVILVRGLMG